MAKTIDAHVYQVEYIAENGGSKTEEIIIAEKNLSDKKSKSSGIRRVKKLLKLDDYSEELDNETIKEKIEPESYKSYSDASYLNVKEIKNVEWIKKVQLGEY